MLVKSKSALVAPLSAVHEITTGHRSLSATISCVTDRIRFLPVTMTRRFSNFNSKSHTGYRHKLRVTGTKCQLPDTMSDTGEIFISDAGRQFLGTWVDVSSKFMNNKDQIGLKIKTNFRTIQASTFSAYHLKISVIDKSSQICLIALHLKVFSHNVVTKHVISNYMWWVSCLICISNMIWKKHFLQASLKYFENLEWIKKKSGSFSAKN